MNVHDVMTLLSTVYLLGPIRKIKPISAEIDKPQISLSSQIQVRSARCAVYLDIVMY